MVIRTRAAMTAAERAARSRAAQLLHGGELMRGTLSARWARCGNPGCQCVRDKKHPVLYLVQSRDGKMQQVYVPRKWEARIRRQVRQHQELQRLIEIISAQAWRELRQRKR